MQRLLIIGAGFAGFWSAISAVRQARELEQRNELEVVVITKDEFHSIRPRFYENTLDNLRVPLSDYFEPLDIKLIQADVTDINPEQRTVTYHDNQVLTYDCLIFAAGSQMQKPDIPGFESTFNVDSFSGASKLDAHIKTLAKAGFHTPESKTFVVVGGGFTGLELVTALPEKLASLLNNTTDPVELFLIERSQKIASGYSRQAQQYITEQLKSAGIRVLINEEVSSIDSDKLTLKSGKTIKTNTVMWAAGLRANPLTKDLANNRDPLGRVAVNQLLQLPSFNSVFVAGDSAKVLVDEQNHAVMSCQHAIPQGKFAGHNAVNILFNEPLKAYSQPSYVTCLDLGSEAALFTQGWNRDVDKVGSEAQNLKTQIVTQWIYPAADVASTLKMSKPELFS